MDTIRAVIEKGIIVIAAGGGGIPVIDVGEGEYRGVAAVIDKDLACSILAQSLRADLLLIATSVIGILLAYGVFGPLAGLLEHNVREESKFYECIKVSLIATLNGAAPQIAIEFGRKVLFHEVRPTYAEVDERVRQK